MFNFPFSFYKYYKPVILNKDLRDYIKKTNMESFNKFAQVNKLKPCLMNYRNYSSSFLNNKISKYEIINEDYICGLDEIEQEARDNHDDKHDHCDNNNSINYYVKKNILVYISTFIGGTTIIGFLFFYYI
jgi:hypothetical protein